MSEGLSASAVWTDPEPFDVLEAQRMHALVAIRETVAERRPLGGREDAFLSLYDDARRGDAHAFAQVWGAPAAHAWVRRTFDTLRSVLGSPGDERARDRLADQLDAFGWFALSLGHVADADVELPRPLRVEAPVGLPGTLVVAETSGDAQVRKLSDLSLARSPVVSVEGAEVVLSPEALAVPGAVWDDVAAALAAAPELSTAHAGVVAEALEAVATFSEAAFTQIRDHVDVVALQPDDAQKYPNASSSEFPGAVLLGASADAFDLADHLIHEFAHNRLFALEGMGGLLEDDASDRYYSPWRDELRSMRGLVHGAYVFVYVFDYWRAVAEEAPRDDIGDRARENAARTVLELRVAISQVRRHARLTDFGRAVVQHVAARIDAMDGGSAKARAAVEAHLDRFDVERQVARNEISF